MQDSVADAVDSSDGQVIVVPHVVAVHLWLKLEGVDEFFTENRRQKFVVSNVLNFGADNTSSFLVQSFFVPVRVCFFQHRRNAVVLTDHERVDGGQADVQVDSLIAGPETEVAAHRVRPAVWIVFILGQNTANVHLEKTPLQKSQVFGGLRGRAVDGAAVKERGGEVHLLAGAENASF